MTDSREFQGVRILIPGYSIEDLPTDLNEQSAASLLNAFSVAWHPWLLNASMSLPEAKHAEATELPQGQHVVLVPEPSADWLAHDWQQQFADSPHAALHSCSSRESWLEAVQAQFGAGKSALDADLVSEFLALGTCHLLVLLLSRRMHHFVDPDHYLLESEAFAAAQAAIDGNSSAARDHLRRCFECLLDCREQFHPVDCFLMDLCLPSEQATSSELTSLIQQTPALSIILSGAELLRHAADQDFAHALQTASAQARLSVLTGHRHELRTSLNPVSGVYADLAASCELLKSIAPDAQFHWARRRYGMTSSLPALLSLFEFSSALHIVLDDGIYPDREYGYLQWQSADNTTIPAVSRIPMAIDSAASLLKFADRYTESMQEDSAAVLLLARLPDLQTPWLNDLKIAARYAPVLGRFVTMTEYIDRCSHDASPVKFDEGEYLSPYLIQSSVLKTEAPISSPADLYAARAALDSVALAESLLAILKPAQAAASRLAKLEDDLGTEEAQRLSFDTAPQDSAAAQADRLAVVSRDLQDAAVQATTAIRNLVPSTTSTLQGLFVVNPLPWGRAHTMDWPKALQSPAANPAILQTWAQDGRLKIQTQLPAGGFLWLHETPPSSAAVAMQKPGGKPLAEPLLLRNQWFEVQLNEDSGGIRAVTFHGQRANRVSQQVAFRYENSKTMIVDDEEVVTSYAVSRLVASRILESGPLTASIETTCEIVSPVDDSVMARYRQTTSVERSSKRLNIKIQFDDLPLAPTGNPWMTYYAARFAWVNEAASIVRSCLGQVAGFRMERFEAPDYVEVADQDHRLLILPQGRPWHRRTGRRMLDSLLVVEGETERLFEFAVEFDQPFPMRSACEMRQPPLQMETSAQTPTSTATGWILALSAKNVVIARSRVQSTVNPLEGAAGISVVLLLEETEGRSANCLIRTARTPIAAHARSASGTVLQELTVTEDGVAVEVQRLQFREVELQF